MKKRGPNHHWSWYIILAVLGGLMTFAGARAQQKATDDATFRKLLDGYCAAWSSLDSKNAAKYYAKDDALVFYDVAPFAYHGWKEYEPGAQKAVLDNVSSVTLTLGKDLRVTRHGNIAWTVAPMHVVEVTKDGKKQELDVRYTGIWEKRGKNWLLVHEHISAPLG